MYPVLQFLGLSLPVSPLFALLAFYLGGELSSRAMMRLNRENPLREAWLSRLNNGLLLALVVGLLAARLAYAARFASLYLDNPSMLLSLRIQTLAMWPGILGGAAALIVYLGWSRVPLARAADALAFGLVGGLFVLNLGFFLSGDAYGTVTFVPWAVEIWGLPRHPVQLYMAAALLGIGLALLRAARDHAPGEIFWRFIMLFGLAELVLDAYRANAPTWGPGIRLVQMGGLAATLIAMFVLSYYAGARQETAPQVPGAWEADRREEATQES